VLEVRNRDDGNQRSDRPYSLPTMSGHQKIWRRRLLELHAKGDVRCSLCEGSGEVATAEIVPPAPRVNGECQAS
jgi:hypothetical protein